MNVLVMPEWAQRYQSDRRVFFCWLIDNDCSFRKKEMLMLDLVMTQDTHPHPTGLFAMLRERKYRLDEECPGWVMKCVAYTTLELDRFVAYFVEFPTVEQAVFHKLLWAN